MNLKEQTIKTKEILNKEKMLLKGKTYVLSDLFDKESSEEYRAEDIDKIIIKDKTDKNSVEDNNTEYIIKPYGSVDAVFDNKFNNEKLAVLNFASSKNPGGGFETGASAQEENLCYHSNLIKSLKKRMSFYEFNRSHLNHGLYTDGIIYSNNITFFRKNFKEVEPVQCDVITCAAPNAGAARRQGVPYEKINETMKRRLEQIIKVAIKHDVKVLVLGAFGCGVFKNDAKQVAKITKQLLVDEGYGKHFKYVVFPLLSKSDRNYGAFNSVFKQLNK